MSQKVSSAAINFILCHLKRNQRILPSSYLSPEILDQLRDAKASVDIASYKNIFLRVVKITGNQNLGLYIGENIRPNALGILGYILENSPTISVALENLLRYHTLLSRSFFVQKSEGGRYVKISLSTTPPEKPPMDRYSNEVNLSAFVAILNDLTKETIRPEVVKFTHRRPENIEAYYPIFGQNLEFEAPNNLIYFSKEILGYPVCCPNIAMLEFFKMQADRILDEEEESYSIRVTRILSEMIHYKAPEVKDVAKRLEITPRTLQNRLKVEGTTFQELIISTKKQLACHYLKTKEINIQEVAERLGYSETSAFNRAFKQWTNFTPREFRKNRGS